MMEEVSCQKLTSPCKLWIVLPLVLSGVTPQILISVSSVIAFSFSTGTFPPAYKHALLFMLQNLFLVLLLPFSYHLFLYLPSQQSCEKSCMNLLIFTHFSTLQVWRLPTFYWNCFWQSQILPSQLNNATVTSQLHSMQAAWLSVKAFLSGLLWHRILWALITCPSGPLPTIPFQRWLCSLLPLCGLWINSSCVRILLFSLLASFVVSPGAMLFCTIFCYWLPTPIYTPDQGLENFLCIGPDSKALVFAGPIKLCCNYSTLLL